MQTLIIGVLLNASLLALGGEISDYHFKHAHKPLGDDSKSRSHDEVAATNHGIAA